MPTLNQNLPHNLIGALASGLCLMHCILTPVIFALQGGLLVHGNEHAFWWGILDAFFLIISLLAVWQSGRTTSKSWVSYSLWVSWIILAVIVLNEKLSVFTIPEFTIYFPTILLIGFHLYNRKYCRCKDDSCCVH